MPDKQKTISPKRKASALLLAAAAVAVLAGYLTILPLNQTNASPGPRCSDCGALIAGQYLTANDKTYHPRHFRCDYCRKPIRGTYIPYGNFVYHQQCYTTYRAPRCLICNQPIIGHHYLDSRGNPYHPEHQDKYDTCPSCFRIMVPGKTASRFTYEDGRTICAVCLSTTINSPEQIQKSESYVRSVLRTYGIEPPTVGIKLVAQQQIPGQLGTCQGLHSAKSPSQYQISMLYGLPETLFNMVLAHELMHAWIQERNRMPDNTLGKQYHEGSCQLASYLILSASKNLDAYYQWKAMEHSQEPDYGNGYRQAKAYAETYGIPTWLQSLTKHQPPQYDSRQAHGIIEVNAPQGMYTAPHPEPQHPYSQWGKPEGPQTVLQTTIFPQLIGSSRKLIMLAAIGAIALGYLISHFLSAFRK